MNSLLELGAVVVTGSFPFLWSDIKKQTDFKHDQWHRELTPSEATSSQLTQNQSSQTTEQDLQVMEILFGPDL